MRRRALAIAAALLLPLTSRAQPLDPYRGTAGDADVLQYVSVNGVRLAYRTAGSGPPVVLVHGESYSHELWSAQLEAFAERHFVLTYDRRGHGQSEAPHAGYSHLAHAEDLHALLNHFGIVDAHFVVHSRGGIIMMEFWRRYPERVRSVLFADAALPFAAPDGRGRGSGASPGRMPAVTVEEALKRREQGKQSPPTKVARSRADIQAVLNRMIDQYSPRVYMDPQMQLGFAVPPPSASDVELGARPILIIVGELTAPLILQGAKATQTIWPKARFTMIPAVDHLLPLEAPEAFNKLALDFFREADDGAR